MKFRVPHQYIQITGRPFTNQPLVSVNSSDQSNRNSTASSGMLSTHLEAESSSPNLCVSPIPNNEACYPTSEIPSNTQESLQINLVAVLDDPILRAQIKTRAYEIIDVPWPISEPNKEDDPEKKRKKEIFRPAVLRELLNHLPEKGAVLLALEIIQIQKKDDGLLDLFHLLWIYLVKPCGFSIFVVRSIFL